MEGPYQITKRVNDLNYEIDLGTGRKRLRTYHVNLLRLYHAQKNHDSDIPSCYLVDTCPDDVTEDDTDSENWAPPIPPLCTTQTQELS